MIFFLNQFYKPKNTMEVSLENVSVDIGAWTVKRELTVGTLGKWGRKWSLEVKNSPYKCFMNVLLRNAFWSLSGGFLVTVVMKLTTMPFAGRTLRGLLIQLQNSSLWNSGIRRKQNLEVLGLKVTQQSWLLLFAFSPPLFFRFPCLIFFFCWAFSRLYFGGKSF